MNIGNKNKIRSTLHNAIIFKKKNKKTQRNQKKPLTMMSEGKGIF
jgi:hypothetical protein